MLDPLDRGDPVSVGLDSQNETAADGFPVEEHGARPAVAAFTADLGTLHPDLRAENLEEDVGGCDRQQPFLAVHNDSDVVAHPASSDELGRVRRTETRQAVPGGLE